MVDYNAVLEFVKEKGWISIPILILILVIHNPDRAEKLKELFFLPFFRVFKLGSRQYMASKVSYTCTEFIKRNITKHIPSIQSVKVRIKWVRSPSDPVMQKDGTLVLCMRETSDQSRNILSATQVALPQVVCSTLRPRVSTEASASIDLVLLQRLAEGLGRHSKPVFQKYFLGPILDDSQTIRGLFQELVELDGSGSFITIFLEELNLLGETLFSSGDTSDKTEAFHELLRFLLREARRKDQQEIPLEHISSEFNIGIILLAKSEKALSRGLQPYLQAIDQNVKLGRDSIYVIAFPHAFGLMERLLDAVDGDERLLLSKVCKIKTSSKNIHPRQPKQIALLRRNPMFSDTSFKEKVVAANIRKACEVEGYVLDVSQEVALVDIMGINATIRRAACAWHTVLDCCDILTQGHKYKFLVASIDEDKEILKISLRLPKEDPWRTSEPPNVGNKIEVTVVEKKAKSLIASYGDFEIIIPVEEVSWLVYQNIEDLNILDTKQTVVVTFRDDATRILRGSIRQMEVNPWPQIQKTLPTGTKLRGTVKNVTPYSIIVELPGNLYGFLPKKAIVIAGYDYDDFKATAKEGQGLDVIVRGVSFAKRRVNLNVKRKLRS
jgi:predicted RNA-binding protein with RPS1 domain